MIAENSFEAHVKKHARCVVDTTVEKSTTASDVANVRLPVQSAKHCNDAEDAEADDSIE